MYRRRLPKRETDFGFDSFLDVVANVIGIVIRFIIIAWVGAQFYTATLPVDWSKSPPPDAKDRAIVLHPLREQIEETEKELKQSKSSLLAYLRDLEMLRRQSLSAEQELAKISQHDQMLAGKEDKLSKALHTQELRNQRMELTLTELRERSKSVARTIDELDDEPEPKTLRYRVPVSKPVVLEELMFECRRGRVAFIDLDAFRREIRSNMDDNVERLKRRWSVSSTTRVVGAFRLHYKLERHRGFDDVGDQPIGDTFAYGLSWIVQPVAFNRGETIEQIAQADSQFQRIMKTVVPGETVITFCVYPDSFELYRRLRDYLYERGFEVAGRPFPHGIPIAASPKGTRSRGQ